MENDIGRVDDLVKFTVDTPRRSLGVDGFNVVRMCWGEGRKVSCLNGHLGSYGGFCSLFRSLARNLAQFLKRIDI